jgi:chromosome segregation protein
MQGFKSFPEKIRLEFNKGITAVVGPNGSGKSNIADAVRWALGEQSAKSLRGAKMEDVIFAGTASRKPLGFAEVSMVIDNSDKKLRVSYSEITVTRRVFRSGEGEYRLNGVTCRLRDIHELFMDTGVGREGYSIISQGRIEEVLSARSDERRLLFEEAAGIVKYKNRRGDAEQELERTRQNLVRVNDIITELEAQLTPLAEQAQKAREYLTLKEQLKHVQINLFFMEISKQESDLQKIQKEITITAEHYHALELQREQQRGELAERKAESREIDEQRRRENAAMEDLSAGIARNEGEIKLVTEQINFILAESNRIQQEISKADERIVVLKGDKQNEEQRVKSLSEELDTKRNKLAGVRREFDGLNALLSDSEKRAEALNAEIIRRITAVMDVKGELQKVRNDREQAESHKARLKEQLDETMESIAAKTRAEQDLREARQATRECSERLDAELRGLAAEKSRLTQEVKRAAALFGDVNKQLHESESRHKVLSELAKNYEGYYKSVKTVLMLKKNGVPGFEGIHGAVGELVTAPKEYEQAIETALGGALQNIVTENEEDARAAIEYLKKQNAGRATFLPITAIHAKTVAEGAPKAHGVIGFAKDLVSYGPVYEGIFASLLGRVIIVDDMRNGIALNRRLNYGYKIVTLEGDFFSPGGAMTGGSAAQKGGGFFGRRRELQELGESMLKLKAENERLAAEQDRLNESLKVLEEETAARRDALQRCALEDASQAHGLDQLSGALADLRERQTACLNESGAAAQKTADLEREAQRLADALQTLETNVAGARLELEKLQAETQRGREEKERQSQLLTDLMIDINSLEQNILAYRRNIGRVDDGLLGAVREIDAHREAIAAKERQLQKKEAETARITEELEALRLKQKALQEAVLTLDNRKDEVLEKITILENETSEITESIGRLGNERTRLEGRRAQMEADNRRLYDELWDEYELTYQTARAYPRLDKGLDVLRREERQLKSALHELGDSVNVGALEEYKHVKARYELLTNQRADILAADEKLSGMIGELTELMVEQFKEQFKLISENFSVVFREMFGGGTAYLELSDEKNILESGIEIIAQPPGKKLQNMSLFSGGERALTAAALLFGILLLKPSPFCILDEVEAALDDANVLRYANFLKNFSHDTQFILITHRKGTMEAADTLYGVTMQEHGVSALVSVKFTEGEAV